MSKDDLKNQIRSGSKQRSGTDLTEVRQEFKQDEEQKPHTLTIRPSYIDKLKDLVHFKKTQGDPYYTQGDAVEEALTLLFDNVGTIPSRPEDIKRKERRRTGRRKGSPSGGSGLSDSDDPFS